MRFKRVFSYKIDFSSKSLSKIIRKVAFEVSTKKLTVEQKLLNSVMRKVLVGQDHLLKNPDLLQQVRVHNPAAVTTFAGSLRLRHQAPIGQ